MPTVFLDYCAEFFKRPTTHNTRNCDECAQYLGYVKCDGCQAWCDSDKLREIESLPEYHFCSECISDNVHPCADSSCDGIQFGTAKHCNICIGEAVNNHC